MTITKAANQPLSPKPRTTAKSRFSVEIAESRNPLLEPGKGVVRVLGVRESITPGTGAHWLHAELEIVESDGSHEIGDRVTYLQHFGGVGRFRAFLAAASGMTTREYEAWNPDAQFEESLFGADNDYSRREDTVIGELVAYRAYEGKPNKDGKVFTSYEWSPVQQ